MLWSTSTSTTAASLLTANAPKALLTMPESIALAGSTRFFASAAPNSSSTPPPPSSSSSNASNASTPNASTSSQRLKNVAVAGVLVAFVYAIYRRSMSVVTQNDFADIDKHGNKIDGPLPTTPPKATPDASAPKSWSRAKPNAAYDSDESASSTKK